jgi:amidohydrolase
MTILLTAAQILLKNRDKIPKGRSVRLLFQPAEEAPGGALPMVQEGCLKGVTEVYGLHNWPLVPFGSVAIKTGPMSSAVSILKINIEGKGAHGSTPEKGHNAITAAAHIYCSLQAILAESISCREMGVLSIGKFSGGERFNVIPEKAEMEGTIRTFDENVRDSMKKYIVEISENTAKAFHCKAQVEFIDMYPSINNSSAEVLHVKTAGEDFLQFVEEGVPMLASEDFSYFSEACPGAFMLFGTKEEAMPEITCHSSHFDFNDKIIPLAAQLFINLAQNRLAFHI